jgi:hypothetical protein
LIVETGSFQMRTMRAFLGSLATIALMSAPVLAKNSNAPPAEEKSAPSPCHMFQQGPDGNWIERPCEEVGAPAQPQPRPTGRGAETAGH